MELQFKVFRFDPKKDQEPSYREYAVTAKPNERILDCLNKIKWDQDDSLGFRLSCAHGVCGSCAVKINGKCGLACQTLVKEYEGGEVLIEPLPGFTVLKDLIVDMELFFERVALIRPFLISNEQPPEKERLQSPEDQKKIDEVIRCILCASCVGACPVSNETPEFIGPAPLVQAFRRIFDSRDDETLERLKQMDHEHMAQGCQNHFECTKVCPKDIKVTKSINFIKREIKNRLGEGA